ncbi:MAG: hypothetical protein JRD93_12985 [Deltaproteobacteria bacterium]|nr:hypothetical protein [Deltaproteobacteria bacterium]
MAKKKINYKYRINDYSKSSKLETQGLFDTDFKESNMSPIDTFFEKTTELNKLIADPDDFPGQLAGLILLGYVSAVESYFREIIRKLILIDKASKRKCEKHSLTYGAAIIYDSEMLPEAMLENCSFARSKNIEESLKNFLGITKGDYSSDLNEALDQFSKVCQLRHCSVHRFGRLGSNNAIALGLEDHKEYLEKPLKIDFNTLQEIFLVCNNIVKEINNFLFEKILVRNVSEELYSWEWDLRKDKNEFIKYYNLFVSEKNPPIQIPSLKKAIGFELQSELWKQ